MLHLGEPWTMSSAGLSESRGSVGCTSRYFMPAWWSITRIFADQERAETDNDLKLDSRETARRLNAKRMKKPIKWCWKIKGFTNIYSVKERHIIICCCEITARLCSLSLCLSVYKIFGYKVACSEWSREHKGRTAHTFAALHWETTQETGLWIYYN